MYNCQFCNKECKSNLSKSCHERYCKKNPNRINTDFLKENAINTNKKLHIKHQEYLNNLKIIKFKCICENCNKIFYIEDFENRKHFPKCCSIFCSHSLSGKTNNKGTKEVKCKICGNIIEINKHSHNYICDFCKEEKNKKDKIKNKKIHISEEGRQKLIEAGKKSAMKQSEIRRSKNEIEFCKLCESYFENVQHNKSIFNGWDADIILPDIKFAILWNGKCHYEPIFGQANYNRVINRDKIKLKEIEKLGYIPYIIKDMGKYNNNFVKEKFNEFIKYLKDNNYII